MAGVLAPLLDPGGKEFDFVRGQLLSCLSWGHRLVRVATRDAPDHLALFRVAGKDRGVPSLIGQGPFNRIQTQSARPTLALTGIRAMTLITVVGKDRLDVAIEVECPGGSFCDCPI